MPRMLDCRHIKVESIAQNAALVTEESQEQEHTPYSRSVELMTDYSLRALQWIENFMEDGKCTLRR